MIYAGDSTKILDSQITVPQPVIAGKERQYMNSEVQERMELDSIGLSEDMLFYGSTNKLKELLDLAVRCLEEIEASDNVRIIVLETWLFIDFCIRELLISGLNLNRLNIEAFDLRFHLLPKNFRERIELITRLKEAHAGLPRDPQEKAVRISIHFLFFLKGQHADCFGQLLDIEEEYYRKYAPELSKKDPLEEALTLTTIAAIDDEPIQCSRISQGWLEAVGRIDEAWVKKVKRLNKARNLAAHSYDSASILQCTGYSGAEAVTHLKEECSALLRDLIGITKAIKGEDAPPA
jgi:hypothetical protein